MIFFFCSGESNRAARRFRYRYDVSWGGVSEELEEGSFRDKR